MRRLVRTVIAGCVAAAACAVGPATAAAAAPTCAEAGEVFNPVPWPQQMLGPERAWPFTRGRGIVVAVLDSGVDSSHPQLKGRVSAGFDAVAGSGPANTDCLGTGTQVAGVIAAQPTESIGLVGMSSSVKILPIRVIAELGSGGATAEPQVLARGIDAAVAGGADVIAVSTITYSDSAALQSAVANALARNVVVVAAVGDEQEQDRDVKSPTPYPADYDGVIGVGAIGPSGERWPQSQRGPYVDLVAPGGEVVTLQLGRGMAQVDGTGVATGFAAATAALARARRTGLDAGEIGQLLFATAIPTAGGEEYGHGIINPYSAVVDRVAEAGPAPLPALARPASGGSPAWARSRDLATTGTALAVLAVLGVLIVAVALPRGRRRFWRSAVAKVPPHRAEPEEPGPPLQLFDDRSSSS